MTAPTGRDSSAARGHTAAGARETAGQGSLADPAKRPWPLVGQSEGALRFAVLSDAHLSPPETEDGRWNNTTKRAASAALLEAAIAHIVAAGHHHVLVLGDVSEFGAADTIAAALDMISDAGLLSWVVPGNHDVALSPTVLSAAAQATPNISSLEADYPRSCEEITVCGHGLRSEDGGQTCRAINLPDPAACPGRLLLWATHYPLLSQLARLRVAGLRYPGDLLNLDEARAAAERFPGPILVLHGHLHAAVIRHAGRILQIGSPAVVEWPHAWTDASVGFTEDTVMVRTELTPIPGHWSIGDLNTVLADHEQNWTFTAGCWRRAAARHGFG